MKLRLHTRQILLSLIVFLSAAIGLAQQPAAVVMPWPRACFYDGNGAVLSGGKLYSYSSGTTTPLSTFVDSSGTIQNTNPITLDAGGCAGVWIGPSSYKFKLTDSAGAQIWVTDNVSDVGQLSYTKFVYLLPAGQAQQNVIGPLGANYFVGLTPHTTSTGVRVSLLAPSFTLDTVSNPPGVSVTQPALAGQTYTIPDPGSPTAAFIMSPNNTGNVLDCTQAGLTCKRRAYVYFEGAGCNNTTAGLGWDTFGTNSPTPLCVTGTNVQKGVLAMPAAATYIQENTGTGVAAGTVTTTYTAATTAGNFLVATVGVDGGKTVTGCTDGTNAYTLAVAKTNGNTDLEIWFFNGNSTTKAAATVLTCTLSGNANAAIDWKEYSGTLTAAIVDVTASNSANSTAVTTGTTAGTAQNTELVIAAVATPSNPSIVSQAGWVKHTTVSQSTNITIADAGKIQQATSTQSGAFTLGTAQAWASAIATFKVSVASDVQAQRTWRIPSVYRAADIVNSSISWQNPLSPTGTVNVQLGAAVACSAAGASDDPAFNADTAATALVSASATNILVDTPLTPLTTTGCAASNLMHLKIKRLRYNANDTYEGFVYVNGASLEYGSSN
jgi:hypothetical protein